MPYHSATKKNEIMPFVATWKDLEMIILSEVRQKEKHYQISLMCRISDVTQMNLSMKQTHRQREQICDDQGGGAGE